jgi:predicted aspartyl protease
MRSRHSRVNILPLLLLAACILVQGSCSTTQSIRAFRAGVVDREDYVQVLPFRYTAEMIIIEVEIGGTVYDFILDTGATCVLSTELAGELGLEPDTTVSSTDGEGNVRRIGLVGLPELRIGDVVFTSLAAAVIHMAEVPEIACLEADGIVGTNLMRTAKWQIDYRNREVRFSDRMAYLDIPGDVAELRFAATSTGTPLILVDFGGQIRARNVRLDTGCAGSMIMPAEILEQIRERDNRLGVVEGFGTNSAGAFGTRSAASSFALVDAVRLGDLQVDDVRVEFEERNAPLVGNKLLENYIVTLDWERETIYLSQAEPHTPDGLLTFGFTPMMDDGRLVVGYVYNDSPAAQAQLEVGDTIISIGNRDYTEVTPDNYCEIVLESASWCDADEVTVVWVDSLGERHEAILPKIDMLSLR